MDDLVTVTLLALAVPARLRGGRREKNILLVTAAFAFLLSCHVPAAIISVGTFPELNPAPPIAVAAVLLALAATSASAQTVANGPYYATPAWDQTLPVHTRFIVLANMNAQAVLDRETGLVWEREPTTERMDYSPALFHCRHLVKGNRQGWRLPTNEEIRTLVSIGVIDGFTDQLPPGHPFILGSGRTYWTATVPYHDPTLVVMMRFNRPDTSPGFSRDRGNSESVWCVRAQGISP